MDVSSLYTDDKICKLLHTYAYNALNRIESAWNQSGEKAAYEYNGLGQRTAKQTGKEREEYLLDLTRPYHNLLGMVKGGNARSFYWDGNVAAMSEKDELHYYLQDELGSPVRVSGYNTTYFTYGYDEFGNDLYHELEEANIPNPYNRQGEEQPFGYTGYRHDDISGTYFAQAREYQPESGRFTAEDVIKGNGAVPETLNRYGYCLGNPVMLVDRDGKKYIIAWSYGQKETLAFEKYMNHNYGTQLNEDKSTADWTEEVWSEWDKRSFFQEQHIQKDRN